MARQTINVGSSPNDKQGDSLRNAGIKINSNFAEVYNIAQSAWNTANTVTGLGTITFSGDLMQGDSGVSISPYSTFTANNQYFRFRGGDDDRHLHFDTSDNDQFDLIVGDDGKFVQINHAGNVYIQSLNTAYYSTYTWTFSKDGQTLFPNNVIDTGTDPIDIKSSNYVEMYYAALSDEGGTSWQANPTWNSEVYAWVANDGFYVQNVRYNDGVNPSWNYTWQFNNDGNLVFPDSSVQTGASISIVELKALVANSATYGDFKTAIANL